MELHINHMVARCNQGAADTFMQFLNFGSGIRIIRDHSEGIDKSSKEALSTCSKHSFSDRLVAVKQMGQ